MKRTICQLILVTVIALWVGYFVGRGAAFPDVPPAIIIHGITNHYGPLVITNSAKSIFSIHISKVEIIDSWIGIDINDMRPKNYEKEAWIDGYMSGLICGGIR